MQTFMPYPDFKESICCLDSKRLGKQRIEAHQILNILLNRTDKKGWRNHPAVKMWIGYEEALKIYYNFCLDEWISKGYENNMLYENAIINRNIINELVLSRLVINMAGDKYKIYGSTLNNCKIIDYHIYNSTLNDCRIGNTDIIVSRCHIIHSSGYDPLRNIELPHWMGDKKFHASHRSNLLRKDPEFYSKYDWEEPDNLPYVWPYGKDKLYNLNTTRIIRIRRK